ncbi:MAG TPA: hypothetical protein VK399_12975, partial [Longimicrobiaceae bacterium]|nr:hypothetical protein [Longimicrobiaceae bacterium]
MSTNAFVERAERVLRQQIPWVVGSLLVAFFVILFWSERIQIWSERIQRFSEFERGRTFLVSIAFVGVLIWGVTQATRMRFWVPRVLGLKVDSVDPVGVVDPAYSLVIKSLR